MSLDLNAGVEDTNSALGTWASSYIEHLISIEDWETLAELYAQIEYHNKYNVINSFNPYEYQMDLYAKGKDFMSRFACFSNRCGKTFSGAREMAWHLTGKYPEWWPGHRFTTPIKAWAIGITGDSTRKVLQTELIGTLDVRMSDFIGTGAIPRDEIILDGLEKDGPTAKVVRVKHYDANGEEDGVSILEFRSTEQGVHTLMGTAQHFIWIDEEAPNKSLEIFTQCATRLATTNGKMLITATPENGVSPLIQKFMDTPEMWIGHVGWDRVPHLTDEVKAALISSYPEWEIPMRTQGIPSAGSGAIFQVEDSFISVPPSKPHETWPIVCGVDFGRSRDPSTIVFCYKDDDDRVVMFHEEYLDKDRSPENMARVIRESPWPNIPIVVPHDGNSVSTDGGSETRAAIMKELGCNVVSGSFSNPPEVQNNISNIHKKHNGKEGGLAWMAHQFKKGSLKVCENLSYFFREKRSYFYVTRGGKTSPKDGDDHVIDAARIAVLSVGRYGIPAGQCKKTYADFNNGFSKEQLSTWEGYN